MRLQQLIIIVSCCFITETAISGDCPRPISFELTGLQDYKLIGCWSDTSESTQETYKVVRKTGRKASDYITIDSIEGVAFKAGDTNAIGYLSFDEDSTYFISLILSPRVRYDTLLSFLSGSYDNWLRKAIPFQWSLRDSLLVYWELQSGGGALVKFIRITSRNHWEEVAVFNHAMSVNLSLDFSQVLLSMGSVDSGGFELDGRLLIYDLATDSLTEVEAVGKRNVKAWRMNKSSPIFLIKKIGETSNLWVYLQGKGEIQLTHYSLPETVYSVRMFQDSLVYHVVIRDEPHRAIMFISFLYKDLAKYISK